MRFLLDECLSVRLTAKLQAAGHDVVHVAELGLCGRSDSDVLEAARQDDRVLISADTDFGELLARQGNVLPSLILFRQGNRSPEHHSATLIRNLSVVDEDIRAGAIVVFTNDNIRIRRLPVTG